MLQGKKKLNSVDHHAHDLQASIELPRREIKTVEAQHKLPIRNSHQLHKIPRDQLLLLLN